MKFSNRFGLPTPLFKALTWDSYKKVGHISVTALLNTPRQRLLAQRHDDDITVEAADNVWLLLGRAVHYVIEQQAKHVDGLAEERLSLPVDGPKGRWTVTGQADLLERYGETLILSDWKVPGVYSVLLAKGTGYVKPEWEQQLNLYRLLFRANGFDVTKLQVGCIFRDWKESDKAKKAEYPECPLMLIDVPLWPVEKAEAFMTERVRVHQEAELLSDDDLPLCTPEERWERGEKWAVMREGRKTAFKLFDTREEASACTQECIKTDGKKYSVEHRAGTCQRCMRYCHGAPWCSQWKAVQAQSQEAKEVSAV